MPFQSLAIVLTNSVFSPLEDLDGAELLRQLGDATTMRDVAVALGLAAVLDGDNAELLLAFLGSIPPSLSTAAVAALRSALERDLRVQFSWQPAYDCELRLWESSEGATGLANIHLLSPHPPEHSNI